MTYTEDILLAVHLRELGYTSDDYFDIVETYGEALHLTDTDLQIICGVLDRE